MPVLKNPKHERFCQELADGKTAADASRLAGIDLKPCSGLSGFYVYLLVDPIDDSVFYVGKGKNKRAFAHVKEWRSGRITNPAKFERIALIVAAGAKVKHFCLMDGLSEADALDTERWLIGAIGLDRLTNWKRGETSEPARVLAMVKDEQKRTRPYCRWKEKILWQLLPGDGSMTAEAYEAVYWDIAGQLSEVRARLEGRKVRVFPNMWKPNGRTPDFIQA